jgi:hypothetical protein
MKALPLKSGFPKENTRIPGAVRMAILRNTEKGNDRP